MLSWPKSFMIQALLPSAFSKSLVSTIADEMSMSTGGFSETEVLRERRLDHVDVEGHEVPPDGADDLCGCLVGSKVPRT